MTAQPGIVALGTQSTEVPYIGVLFLLAAVLVLADLAALAVDPRSATAQPQQSAGGVRLSAR